MARAAMAELLGPQNASIAFVGSMPLDRRGIIKGRVPEEFSEGGKFSTTDYDRFTELRRELGFEETHREFAGNPFHQSQQFAKASILPREVVAVTSISRRNGYIHQAGETLAQHGVRLIPAATFDGEPDQALVAQINTPNGPEDLIISFKNKNTPRIPLSTISQDVIDLGSTAGDEWPDTWFEGAQIGREGEKIIVAQYGSQQVRESQTPRGRRAIQEVVSVARMSAGNSREGLAVIRAFDPDFVPSSSEHLLVALGGLGENLQLVSNTKGPAGSDLLVMEPDSDPLLLGIRAPSEMLRGRDPRTRGSGDAHHGVMMAVLLDTNDPRDALVKAGYAGTLVATHESATEPQPTLREIESGVKTLVDFTPRESVLLNGLPRSEPALPRP